MRERVLKFIIMIIAVVAVGAGFTLLNLRLQDGSGRQEVVDFGREEEVRNNINAASGADGASAGGPANGGAAGAAEAQQDESADMEEEAAAASGVETAAETAVAAETEAMSRIEADAETSAVYGESAGESDEIEAYVDVQESSVTLEIVTESGPEERAEDYYSRLSEMDSHLTSNTQTAQTKTAADQQAAADAALTFWDDELNMIYQALRDQMPEEEFIQLRDEERAWIRQRDEAASQAAVSQTQSSSAQQLAYTNSLLEWTKDRVYVLAKMYYGE